MAKRHAIPFYVACPVSTIDFSTASGDLIPIEQRAPEELTGYQDKQWAPSQVNVLNPSFDVTPSELVAGLITEHGIVPSTSDGIRHIQLCYPASCVKLDTMTPRPSPSVR